MVSKFADNSIIGGIVDNKDIYQELQRELDQQGKWAKKWLMEV